MNFTVTSSSIKGSKSVKLEMCGNLITEMTYFPLPRVSLFLKYSESSLGRSTSKWGITPSTGIPVISSSKFPISSAVPLLDLQLLRMIPLILFLSFSGISSTVPKAYAKEPPHSIFTTNIQFASAASAANILAMSLS